MFQTARELFQQRMEEEEEEEEEERREWRKPRIRSGQMYHVNANGEFSDSGGEEEEEEESIAEQIRRKIGLGSRIAVEKGKPGIKGAKTTQTARKSVETARKSMQSTQKSMQSTINFNQHASKSTSLGSQSLESASSSLPPPPSTSNPSSLHPSKSQETLLPTSTSPQSNPKPKPKPKSKPSPEKKAKPTASSSSASATQTTPSSASHTHSSLPEPPSSAPSRKRPSPSPSTLESPLDLSKASDRSMSLLDPHLITQTQKAASGHLRRRSETHRLSRCLCKAARQVRRSVLTRLPLSLLACRRSITSPYLPISPRTGWIASPGSRRGCRSIN